MKQIDRILANLREIMMTQIKWTSMIYRAVALSGVFFLSAGLQDDLDSVYPSYLRNRCQGWPQDFYISLEAFHLG